MMPEVSTSNGSTNQENAEGQVSFVKDIQLMMYGLGDCSQPLTETAELIEEIVLRQMVCAVNRARSVAHMRSQDVIAPDDLLFLMRNDLEGLKRLIEYLGVKDDRQMLNKQVEQPQSEDPDLDFIEEDSIPVTWEKSRKQYCYVFLRSIGIDRSDIETTEDVVKQERLMRANETTLNISTSAYAMFQAARQASFGAAQVTPTRFLKWIRRRGGVICDLKPPVVELLVYLAKETIARIVDRVLTLRQESGKYRMKEPPPISKDEVLDVIRLYCQLQSVPLSMYTRDIMNYVETRLIAI